MADDKVLSEISKMKVADLRRELKIRNLSINGNKTELMERLQSAMQDQTSIHSKTETLSEGFDDDTLNHEEDLDEYFNGETIENFEQKQNLDEELDADLAKELSIKRKLSEISTQDDDSEKNKKNSSKKKIVINRTIPLEQPLVSTDTSNSSVKSDEVKNNLISNIDLSEKSPIESSLNEKKVIKISALTEKERLEMRAKKFGVQNDQLKKEMRLQRFGGSSITSTNLSSNSQDSKIDILKKRAERFGTSVSPAVAKLEVLDKLERRKQRFGVENTTKSTKTKITI